MGNRGLTVEPGYSTSKNYTFYPSLVVIYCGLVLVDANGMVQSCFIGDGQSCDVPSASEGTVNNMEL